MADHKIEHVRVRALAKIAVVRKDMSQIPNNPFGPQQPVVTGRVINKVKRYISPSGKVLELQWVTLTIQDNQGIYRTEETIQTLPPMDDGTTPLECQEIRECFRCYSLIHVENSFVCPGPGCGLTFCRSCGTEIEISEQITMLCMECARKINTPVFLRLIKKALWG